MKNRESSLENSDGAPGLHPSKRVRAEDRSYSDSNSQRADKQHLPIQVLIKDSRLVAWPRSRVRTNNLFRGLRMPIGFPISARRGFIVMACCSAFEILQHTSELRVVLE